MSAISTERADAPRNLIMMLAARTVLNMPMRIVYPFLPAIARGLGVPLETAGLLFTVRGLVSAAGPLYGFLADRYGRRRMMLVGLAALVVGAAVTAAVPTFGLALVGFSLLGFSKASFDPAMQAYVGDTVPYARRGRVMGIMELPWSLSWFIGVPLVGFIIAAAGWRAPFWLLAGLGLISLGAMWRLCPGCGDASLRRASARLSLADLSRNRRQLIRIATILSVPFLLVAAHENVFIVYGAWMEQDFGLSVSALGVASVGISGAELIGELASAGLVDRLGKRRAVLVGLILNVFAYLLLPRLAGALGGALFGVFLVFLTFEFSIVCLLPLLSELTPNARAMLMALSAAIMSLGRVLSSLTGPRLWTVGGLSLNGLVSAALVALAVVFLWRTARHLA